MYIDDREKGLMEFITGTISHLPVGDIWIGMEGTQVAANGLLIERKSAADLEASILDGRYREQRSRLTAYATERKAHPVYIIEGELDRLGARLGKSALMKHLTRLMLRYHIAVFQTSCTRETAELCELLEDQWKKDPTTFEQPSQMTYIETRGVTREANSDDPKVFATSVLSCCRGISVAGATAILTAFASLDSVWKASEAELAAIQIGKQKLGAVKAARLHSLLHSSYTPSS